jgi:Protein of unknown function (DUF2798)
MRKLPKRYAGLLLPFFLSFIMTGIATSIGTARAFHSFEAFMEHWPTTWLYAWMVGFPTVLVVLPLVRRLVGMLVED